MKNKLINIIIYAIIVSVSGAGLYYGGTEFGRRYINTTIKEVKVVMAVVIKSLSKEAGKSFDTMSKSVQSSSSAMVKSAKDSGKALEQSVKQSGKDIEKQAKSALIIGALSGKNAKEIAKDGKEILKGQEDSLKADVKAQEKSLKNELKAQEDKLMDDLMQVLNAKQVEEDVKQAVLVAALKAVVDNSALFAGVIISLCVFIASVFLLAKNLILLVILAIWGTGKLTAKGTSAGFKAVTKKKEK